MLCLLKLTALVACNRETSPVAIELGRDACASCKMTIVDGRYGGEIVTEKGKVYPFDSVDCLIHFQQQSADLQGQTYIVDFAHPGVLISSDQAVFGTLETRSSPMGSRYVGFSSAAEAQATLGNSAQPLLTWSVLFHNLKQ